MIIYGILYFTAPCISNFYKESILIIICRILGIDVIINSFALVQRTILQINVDFKRLTKISLISTLISGLLGVFFAWKGFGIWALLIQRLTNTVFQTILLWITSDWRPHFLFSVISFRQLFSFGSKLMLGGLLHTIYMNLYPLIIGRFFTPINVGLFTRAQQLGTFPSTNITYIVKRVTYPMLCAIQDDNERMEKSQFHIMRLTAFIVFPLMVGMAVLAEPLISFLLTDKWLSASPMLSLLCFAYMWFPIMSLNDQLLNIKGRSDLSLRAEVLKKIVAILLLLGSISLGIKAVCASLVLYSFCDMIIVLLYVRKITQIGFIDEIKNLMPICVITIIMGSCIWMVEKVISTPLASLIIGTITGIVVYFLLIFLFKMPERKYINTVFKKAKLIFENVIAYFI